MKFKNPSCFEYLNLRYKEIPKNLGSVRRFKVELWSPFGATPVLATVFLSISYCGGFM